MHKKLFAILLLMLLSQLSHSAAICVVAKWKGSVLDYVFLYDAFKQPFQLQEEAEAKLAEKGYDFYDRGLDIRHAQGQTYIKHGYAVVIEANYIPKYRKHDTPRRSIGCGFSLKSYDEALWEAMHDLQQYDWGWVPDRDGYKVIEKLRF